MRLGLGLLALAVMVPGALAAQGSETRNRGSVYVNPDMPPVDRLLVLPLKAPTAGARELYTGFVVEELNNLNRYTVVPLAEATAKLGLPEMAMAALSDQQAVDIGKRLGVDAVVLGTVGESRSASASNDALVSLRALLCSSGEPVWKISLVFGASTADRLDRAHAAKMVSRMVKTVAQRLPPMPEKEQPPAMVEEDSEDADIEAAVAASVDDYVMRDASRPVRPIALTVKSVGLREVSLGWAKPIDRPDTYRVERSLNPRGDFRHLADVSPRRRFYRDTDGQQASSLADDTSYYYRLVAVSKDGVESLPTEPVEAHTPPPPLPPAELETSVPDARLVDLSWWASNSESVTEYRIERAEASSPRDFEQIAVVSDTRYRDQGEEGSPLRDACEYLYRIRSVNAVRAVGSVSRVVAATTLPRPQVVSDLAVVDRSVRCVPLTWAESMETNVVEYHVYRAESEADEFKKLTVIGGRDRTRFVDGGGIPGTLKDDHNYYYQIVAMNSAGSESLPSEVIRATTRDIPPVVRRISAASDEPRRVTLTWEQSPDEKVVGYEIWRAVEHNDNFSLVGRTDARDAVGYLDRGGTRRRDALGLLLDGTLYRYKVLAFNTADVRSKWSAEAKAKTKVAPVQPGGAQATTDKPRRVELSWKANPEIDIAHYVVEASDRPDASFRKLLTLDAPPDTAQVAARDDGLRDAEVKYYRVKAVDTDGLESEWSEAVQGQAKPAPDSPRNLNARTAGRKIRVSWDPPPQLDIQEYRVWRKTLLSWKLLDATEDTEYELPSSDATRALTLCVTSVDLDGLESGRSESVRTEAVRAGI